MEVLSGQTLALVSGLIGALLSGAFGFGVRYLLDERNRRVAEERAAYVRLVQVSDLVAIEKVVRIVVKPYIAILAPGDWLSV